MSNINPDFRNGRHVVYCLHAHVVLTPKYRRKVFSDEVSEIVRDSIQYICDKNNVILEEFNTDLDHAHMVISYPPSLCLSTFIGKCKGYSSWFLRKNHWELIRGMLWGDNFWSSSYFVSSTGGAPLEKVRKYVQDQGNPPRGAGNPLLQKR